MIHNFRLIFEAAERDQVELFDLDFMTAVLTNNYQASSRGAVGAVARERSADSDRSRDPLYNQLKMYSEVYRMLGWLRPGGKRLEFTTSILGAQVADDFSKHPDLLFGLVRQCLLAVCFPNPATDNVGVVSQRPFNWLIRLTAALGGHITRHEIILGLLAVVDDRSPNSFTDSVTRIKNIRGGSRAVLDKAVSDYAGSVHVQVNTLENYTRLPVGVLKSTDIGWAVSGRVTGLYSRPTEALSLTSLGFSDAAWASDAIDIRERYLDSFSLDERAHFANYAFYAMLLRSGLRNPDIEKHLTQSQRYCATILEHFEIKSPEQLLYSPIQQASDHLLSRAEAIEQVDS
jgi:hypothetical protein